MESVFLYRKGFVHYSGAGTVVRDGTFRPTVDRAEFLTITFFIVRDGIFISPVLTEVIALFICKPLIKSRF